MGNTPLSPPFKDNLKVVMIKEERGNYRKSGNFRVMKLLYNKFLCWKFFVGTIYSMAVPCALHKILIAFVAFCRGKLI